MNARIERLGDSKNPGDVYYIFLDNNTESSFRHESFSPIDTKTWGEAVRTASEHGPSEITWTGFPDLDQAIRDYVNAGGEL